jgi:hypothetical protein
VNTLVQIAEHRLDDPAGVPVNKEGETFRKLEGSDFFGREAWTLGDRGIAPHGDVQILFRPPEWLHRTPTDM